MKIPKTWICMVLLFFSVAMLPTAYAAETITAEYVTGNADGVISDKITLPAETESGLPIVKWESGNMQELVVAGGFAYPIASAEAKEVTLTATVDESGQTARIPVTVVVPQKTERWVTLIEEHFETTEEGGLPAKSNGEWVRGGSTDAHKSSIGVVREDGNGFLRVNNVGKGVSAGDDMMAYLRVDTSGYDRVRVSFRGLLGPADSNVIRQAWLRFSRTLNFDNSWLRTDFRESTLYFHTKKDNANGGNITYTAPINRNEWNHFDFLIDQSSPTEQSKFSVLLNQEAPASVTSDKAHFWGPGKLRSVNFGTIRNTYVNLAIDDVVVSVDEIITSKVQSQLDEIAVDGASAATDDLKLPLKTPDGALEVEWQSSDPARVKNDGTVIRPASTEEDETVTLYALTKSDGNWICRQIPVTVLRKFTDAEKVAADEAYVTLSAGELCTKDLLLRTKGPNGSEIVWESDHPELIDPITGKVTLPDYTAGVATEVTLTGRAVSGEVQSEPHSFTFRVPDNNLALGASLSASSVKDGSSASCVLDYQSETAWEADENDENPVLDISFSQPMKINHILLEGTRAQIQYSTDGYHFENLGTGSDLSFQDTVVSILRFRCTEGRISSVGVYRLTSDEQCVALDAAALDLGDTGAVRSDLTIPLKGENGSDIVCTSDDTSVITSSGKVTRPAGNKDATVHLTFTFTKGEATKTITIPVTVKCTESGSGSKAPSGSNVVSSASDKRGGGGGGAVLTAPINGAEPNTQPDTKPTETLPFTDISGSWARTEILSFYERGIVSGEEGGSFSPDRAVTRAEFVKLLLGAFGIETEEGGAVFADVSPSDWYAPYVKTAAKRGLVCGIDDERFAPLAQISRADMAVMLSRAWTMAEQTADAEGEPFADEASLPSYAQEAVKAMSSLKVLQGYPDGTYRPLESVSRAQAVAALYRLAEKLA